MLSDPTREPPLGLAILDTNTVLDWLVFEDPAVHPLVDAICSGRLGWIVCAAMQLEFERVTTGDKLSRWQPDPERWGAAWARWASPRPAPVSAGPLRCSDPDDQIFIDLALVARARWLLTRDRALLKLARRAAPLGVHVLTPARWADQMGLTPA